MDLKSAAAIAMLIMLLGITAYIKREKISGISIGGEIREMLRGALPEKGEPAPGKVPVKYSGEGSISGKVRVRGEAVFYFPERTKIGNKVEAEKWVTMNITSAYATIGEGIEISGKASRIVLENGIVDGPFDINFRASSFSVDAAGNIDINGTSGKLSAGSLTLSPSGISIDSFSGRIDWMWNKSLEGMAHSISASENGLTYTVSGE